MRFVTNFINTSLGSLTIGGVVGMTIVALLYGFGQLNQTSVAIGLFVILCQVVFMCIQRLKLGAWDGLRGLIISVIGLFFLCNHLYVGHILGAADLEESLTATDRMRESAIYLMTTVFPWLVPVVGFLGTLVQSFESNHTV